jgi:hypothetical protein
MLIVEPKHTGSPDSAAKRGNDEQGDVLDRVQYSGCCFGRGDGGVIVKLLERGKGSREDDEASKKDPGLGGVFCELGFQGVKKGARTKNEARMLCSLGIVSNASNMFMYLVCTLSCLSGPPGLYDVLGGET